MNKFLISLIIISTLQISLSAALLNSKHDLQPFNGDEAKALLEADICIFCHTPHGTSTSFEGHALWSSNSADESFVYNTYGNTTDSEIGLAKIDTASGNSSKACLSCHDGVSAIISIVNAPGSGVNLGIKADEVDITSPANYSFLKSADDGVTNDHPVSIKYVAGRRSLRDSSSNFGGDKRWSTPDGSQTIYSVLRGPSSDMIECGSCHDPHLGEATTFLRVGGNKTSLVCLGCHKK